MSRFHFHRLFTAVMGVTPRAYAAAHRARRVRDALAAGSQVTTALYDAGFNSASRFYAAAPDLLGMTPTKYRSGGTDMLIRFAVRPCSLGLVLIAATEKGICAITLGDDADALIAELRRRFPSAQLVGGDRSFEGLIRRVVHLVEAPQRAVPLPLDIRGTAFQQRVWQALRGIAPGTTESYASIATRIGAPRAVRAVSAACAANPIAVAVPCHRVVRADGSVAGYRWGVARKKALLARESRSLTRF